MSPDSQFWWNWWVQLAVAVGTFAAVFVALFGDWVKSKFFRPNLLLSLVSPKGSLTTATLQSPSGETRSEQARYYHVRVANQKNWPTATQLQIYLTRLEEFGPDGEPIIKWSGDIPLRWKFQEIHPLVRTIGPAADCDLCSVVKGKWIELHPLVVPNNLQAHRAGKADFVVSLQARSNEGESKIHRFRISWDGQWHDGENEMANHLVVKEVS